MDESNPCPARIIYDSTEGVHVGFASRRNPKHTGMTVGEIMKFPEEGREWTFGLDSMEEANAVIGRALVIKPEADTLDYARVEGFRFVPTGSFEGTVLGRWDEIGIIDTADSLVSKILDRRSFFDAEVESILGESSNVTKKVQYAIWYMLPFLPYGVHVDIGAHRTRTDTPFAGHGVFHSYLERLWELQDGVLAWERTDDIDLGAELVSNTINGRYKRKDSIGMFEAVETNIPRLSWKAYSTLRVREMEEPVLLSYSEARRLYSGDLARTLKKPG